MRLLVDGQNCPNTVLDFCDFAAEKIGTESIHLRPRSKDLYMQQSEDFEKEVKKASGYEAIDPLLDMMEPGDLVITSDLDLAERALSKVTAVIDPDGSIFTSERINLLNAQRVLSRLQGLRTVIEPLKQRSEEQDEAFRRTLFQFIGTVA